jgi:hypothetical protein
MAYSKSPIRDLFLGGVYNVCYEIWIDGGPYCASESTFGFKYFMGLLHLPMHLILLYFCLKYVATHHELKKNYLLKSGRGLYPSLIEKMQGLLCFTILASQIYFKIHSRTVIFILNPCHFITFTFALVSILPFNRFTDVLFSVSLGGCFGAWVGLVFAENGELSQIEHAFYYIQHIFAAFMAPLVLYLGGRYSASD